MFKAGTAGTRVFFIALVALVAIAFIPAIYGTLSWMHSTALETRAEEGEFVGGFLGGFVGPLSLAVVIFFSRFQIIQQLAFFAEQKSQTEHFFFFQSFRDGLELIAQWDIKSPGCAQAMRTLDYYSRIALA